jgi:hypothetical protein
LHDNQRQKLIEPLRSRFEEKLKNEIYICKKCGNGFRPKSNSYCYAHLGNPVKSELYVDNVWSMSCCPNVLYFARGNGIPLPSVKRYLGLCSKNMSNELHSNDDFNNLKLITSNDASLDTGKSDGKYNFHGAVVLAAREEGFPLTKKTDHFGGAIYPAEMNGYSISKGFHPTNGCLPPDPHFYYSQRNATNDAHQQNISIYSLDNLSINSQQNIRYPNPKANHRFGPSDWDDYWDNDHDYEDDERKRRGRKKKKKGSINSNKQQCILPQLQCDSGINGTNSSASNSASSTSSGTNGIVNDVDEEHRFQNPPGEFEIGIWRP